MCPCQAHSRCAHVSARVDTHVGTHVLCPCKCVLCQVHCTSASATSTRAALSQDRPSPPDAPRPATRASKSRADVGKYACAHTLHTHTLTHECTYACPVDKVKGRCEAALDVPCWCYMRAAHHSAHAHKILTCSHTCTRAHISLTDVQTRLF